jgi:peptidoglycan-associated lipoprotein
VAAACGSNEPKQEPTGVTDRTTPVNPPTIGSNVTTNPTTPNMPIARNPLTDPSNPLYKRSVYFDYDSNAVKDEYKGLVQAHSRYLAEKRDSRIRIEGNCDERGSREYNLALGQRRAGSVKKVMTVLGVPDAHRDGELRRREAGRARSRQIGLVARIAAPTSNYAGE